MKPNKGNEAEQPKSEIKDLTGLPEHIIRAVERLKGGVGTGDVLKGAQPMELLEHHLCRGRKDRGL